MSQNLFWLIKHELYTYDIANNLNTFKENEQIKYVFNKDWKKYLNNKLHILLNFFLVNEKICIFVFILKWNK